jgi:uncharacterized protein (TIGR03086 family)
MELRSDEVFLSGLEVFDGVVDAVAEGDWDRPSPCEGWSALDVLGHLGSAVNFGVHALRGEDYTWPEVQRPADLVDGPPAQWWSAISAAAREAVPAADLDLVMDTPMGPRTVADRLAFPAIDLYVHAWDIARATGRDVTIPTEVVEFAHSYIDPFPDEMMRGAKGAFGAEVDPPDDATDTERFIAWTGRSPRGGR